MKRQDIQDATGRNEYYPGQGNLRGYGNGKPTNGQQGFAPGAIYQDFADGFLYLNTGTFSSSAWSQIFPSVNAAPVTLTAAAAMTAAANGGRTMLLSLLAGFAVTLPAAKATGTKYKFVVGIVNTSGSYTITTAGTDVFNGALWLSLGGAAWNAAANGESFISTANKTINLDGTGTTNYGGFAIGDWLEVQDIMTGVWSVTGFLSVEKATPVTPFTN